MGKKRGKKKIFLFLCVKMSALMGTIMLGGKKKSRMLLISGLQAIKKKKKKRFHIILILTCSKQTIKVASPIPTAPNNKHVM